MTSAADITALTARKTLLDGDIDAAISSYEQALDLDPENSDEIRAILKALKTEETQVLGLNLYLPRDIVRPGLLLALAEGSFELGERQAAVADIRPNDLVFEFGAGLGTVTLGLCLLHPDTPVVAFEANPRLENILRRNVELNNAKAEVVGALAALSDGTAEFHIAPSFVSSSALRVAKGAQTVTRPTVDVPRLVRERRPTVLIMDIEGSEIELLMAMDLDSVRRIVVEFHPRIHTDTQITDTVSHLIAQGFDLNLAHCRGQVIAFDRREKTTSERQAQP